MNKGEGPVLVELELWWPQKIHKQTSKCNGGKNKGGGVGSQVRVRFCCSEESDQGKPRPKVRDLEKRNGHVGIWEKSAPHQRSLR